MLERTTPKFDVGKRIKVPIQICESMVCYIAQREWGPDNRFLMAKHAGWVYTLQEVRSGQRITPPPESGLGFLASEREMVQWQRGQG